MTLLNYVPTVSECPPGTSSPSGATTCSNCVADGFSNYGILSVPPSGQASSVSFLEWSSTYSVRLGSTRASRSRTRALAWSRSGEGSSLIEGTRACEFEICWTCRCNSRSGRRPETGFKRGVVRGVVSAKTPSGRRPATSPERGVVRGGISSAGIVTFEQGGGCGQWCIVGDNWRGLFGLYIIACNRTSP